MDTQFKDIFKVTFCYRSSINEIKYNEKIDIKFREQPFLENNQCIEENRLIDIIFNSKFKDAKLYMEGLEVLPDEFINQDSEGNVYLEPSDKEIPFSSKDFYPLIPGRYTMKVKVSGQIYYSSYEVINKLISNKEAKIIKQDLENEINGLAFELIRRNMSIGDDFLIDNLPEEIYKFYKIKSRFSNIISALMDLRIRPNYKIKKVYKIQPEENVRYVDNITIKTHLEGSVKQGFMKVPVKEIDYDLPENRWVKKIIEYVFKILNEFIKNIDNYIHQKKVKLYELKKYGKANINYEAREIERVIQYILELKQMALKMRNSINIIKATEWYNNLTSDLTVRVPHVLIQDSRYNTLYKLYIDLNKKDYQIKIDDKFTFQWKRTDYLYEIWCYIKICRLIKEKLGFNIEGGWIFDSINDNKNILIPELQSKTRVKFKKENISMNFVYDMSIPYSSKETQFDYNPIYIVEPNNRPDGRLDIYNDGMYVGSLIFEFKYRDRKNLWHNNYIKNFNENGVIKQLICYSSSCKSNYTYSKGLENKIAKRINPIYKVLVMYPNTKYKYKVIDKIEDHNINFLAFRPNNNEEVLVKIIDEEIKEIVNMVI